MAEVESLNCRKRLNDFEYPPLERSLSQTITSLFGDDCVCSIEKIFNIDRAFFHCTISNCMAYYPTYPHSPGCCELPGHIFANVRKFLMKDINNIKNYAQEQHLNRMAL